MSMGYSGLFDRQMSHQYGTDDGLSHLKTMHHQRLGQGGHAHGVVMCRLMGQRTTAQTAVQEWMQRNEQKAKGEY